MRRQYRLLGGAALPMATVGSDFEPYAQWMDQCGVNRKHIKVLNDTYTGQAFITTDLDDNQITAFHPGAMSFSHENKVTDAASDTVSIGIVSPDGRDGMMQHAEQFADAGIPFIFDPGQGMPMFSGDELLRFLDQATWAAFNDYEAQLMQERTGKPLQAMADMLDALIVTMGGKGSVIYHKGQRLEIPTAETSKVSDPTGCGDAFRAGLLYGLMNDMDWETTARVASLMGAVKIEKPGTQNHSFSREEFANRFKASFGRGL